MRTTKLQVILCVLVLFVWNRCSDDTTPEPVNCDVNPIVLELVSTEDSKCGDDIGKIEVRATGGSGTYKFRLGTQNDQASAVFQNLAAGIYTIIASDANACADTLDVTVSNSDGLNITFTTEASGCGTTNGGITVTPSGGVEPYQFKLDQGAFGSSGTFSALARGSHTVVVKDASGCEISQDFTILSGIRFSATVSGIIQNNCAVSGCHNGTQAPDFRTFKNIKDNAGQVKTLTGNRTMPQNGTLTQEQINAIACWVDDGAPDN